jgi:CRP-like cAMP-binding protein
VVPAPGAPAELQQVEELAEDVPLTFDEPEPPAGVPLAGRAPPTETAFALIMSAASQAVAAGVEDRVHVDPDLDEDAGPAAGDEPALAGATGESEVALPEPPVDAVDAAPARAAVPDPRLPRVPLLSDLGRDALLALTEGMVLHRYTAGEPVLREGELGDSLYVVASGRFAVSKRDGAGEAVVLAHLGEGDFFGEMALLSGAPRAATVEAEGPAEVLELPAALLQSLAGRHPHLADSLRRFYRRRLLANAMAVSPVFRPFGRPARKAIIERFRSRDVRAGEVIIREGTPSDGLYVVLHGVMDVIKRRAGRQVLAGQLREGDLFGEVSCLRKTPATATVSARRAGSLLRLPRADFDALVMTYPQILELVSTLSDERLEGLDAILSGHAEYTEDGLVLI